ncbi:MAG: HEAT repeat domain-containing protein [Planctomycetaceae bacterium]
MNCCKHGLNRLAMIAGRAFEEGHPLSAASLVEPIVAISQSEQTLDRHQAAFILGLLESPDAQHRLEVLLQDPDLMTRANAAIGLGATQVSGGTGGVRRCVRGRHRAADRSGQRGE